MARILGERPHLLVPAVKRVFFIPSSSKQRKQQTVTGRASTGEISDKGLMVQEEDWDGRVAATAMPATIHLKRLPDGRVVRKTMTELIEEGRFVAGVGPTGVGFPR